MLASDGTGDSPVSVESDEAKGLRGLLTSSSVPLASWFACARKFTSFGVSSLGSCTIVISKAGGIAKRGNTKGAKEIPKIIAACTAKANGSVFINGV